MYINIVPHQTSVSMHFILSVENGCCQVAKHGGSGSATGWCWWNEVPNSHCNCVEHLSTGNEKYSSIQKSSFSFHIPTQLWALSMNYTCCVAERPLLPRCHNIQRRGAGTPHQHPHRTTDRPTNLSTQIKRQTGYNQRWHSTAPSSRSSWWPSEHAF